MNNTLLIILAVALVAVGVVGWFILSSDNELPEAEESGDHVFVEPVPAVPTAADVTEVESTKPQTESSSGPTADVMPVSTMWAVDGVIDLGEYAHSTTVVDVKVHWWNDANMLRIGLESPGTGYVAIGFDPVRGMEGANYIIGYVLEGEAYVRDDFGISGTTHVPDTERGGENNILLAKGSEWADHTVLEFMIPLDSGDAMDKPLRDGETYTILVAYHDLADGFAAEHSRSGTGEIQLDPVP
jgi:hypothetical protein